MKNLSKDDLDKLSVLLDNLLYHSEIEFSDKTKFTMIDLKAKIDTILDEE